MKPPTIGVSGIGGGLSDTFARVKGLRADTEYQFTIYAVKGDLRGIPAVVTQRTALPPTGSISIVEDTVTQDSMTVQWSEVTNVESYSVEVQPNTGVIGGGKGVYSTQATLRGMSSNTLYTITVTAVNWVGVGAPAKVTQYTKLVPPRNLRVIVATVTSTSMGVYWDGVVGASKYVVRVTPFDPNRGTPTTVIDTDLVLRNLQPDVSYKIEVAARNRAGDSLFNSVSHRTLSVCHALARDFQEDRFTLQCPGSCLSDDYSVYGTHQYTTDSNICAAAIHDGRLNNAVGGSAVVVKKPGLTFFVGTASNGVISDNYGSYDRSFVFGLQSPSDLRVVEGSVQHNSFSVQWGSVNGAESYRVETIPSTDIARSLSKVTDTKVHLSGLRSNTTYLVYVTAANDLEISESASIYQSTTLEAPANLGVVGGSVTFDRFELVWGAVKGAQSYAVQVTSPNGTLVVNEQTPQNTFVVGGLLGGTLYNATVRAIGRHGAGQPAMMSQYTDLQQPGGVVAKYVRSDSMQLYWDEVHGADVYHLSVGVCCGSSGKAPLVVHKNSRFLEDLEASTNYQFVVTAATGGRESAAAFFTQRTALPAIQDLQVMNGSLSEDSAVLLWTSMAEADSYSLHISATSGSTQTLNLSNRHKSYKLTDLVQNTEYFVTMHATDDVGTGDNSTISFKTKISPPAVVEASYNHHDLVYLTWTPNPDATSYVVTFDPKRSIDDLGVRRFENKTVVEGMKAGLNYNITVQAVVGIERGLPTTTTYKIPLPVLDVAAVFSVDAYTLGVTWKSDSPIAWVSYNTTGHVPWSVAISADNPGYVVLSDLQFQAEYTIQLYSNQIAGFINEPIFGVTASTALKAKDGFYDVTVGWSALNKEASYSASIEPSSTDITQADQQSRQTTFTNLQDSMQYVATVTATDNEGNSSEVAVQLSRARLMNNEIGETPFVRTDSSIATIVTTTKPLTTGTPDWFFPAEEEGTREGGRGEGRMWIAAVAIGGALLLLLLCVILPCCCGRREPLTRNHGCCFCCRCCRKSRKYRRSGYNDDSDDSG